MTQAERNLLMYFVTREEAALGIAADFRQPFEREQTLRRLVAALKAEDEHRRVYETQTCHSNTHVWLAQAEPEASMLCVCQQRSWTERGAGNWLRMPFEI